MENRPTALEALEAPAQLRARDRVGPMLACVWLTVAVLTLYRASDVRDAAMEAPLLRQQPRVMQALDALVALSDRTGAAAARQQWAALVEGLERPRPVLRREEPGPVAPRSLLGVAASQPDTVPDAPTPRLAELGPPRVQRVLLVGASSVQFYLGAELERRLEEHRGVTVHRLGKLGTGLARPDEFDWPKKLDELLGSFQPDLVIAMFGGNDGQTLRLDDGSVVQFGTAAWDGAYRARLEGVIQRIRAAKAHAVMIGMPVMRSEWLSKRIARINALTEQASLAGGAVFIPTWDVASDTSGQYQPTIEHRGETGLARLPDGVHYSRLGARYVSERLTWRLQRNFRLTATDPALAEAIRLDFRSQLLDGPVSYVAYVPQGLGPAERLPVLYLLHGAGGGYADWSDHAHETLQRLAHQHRLIVVTPEGRTDSWYLESPRVPGGRAETYLLEELIPHVQRHLPTNGRRSIGGLSMGGHGALSLALKYPGTFVAASSMSGALDLSQATTREALIARLGPYANNRSLWHRHSVAHLVRAHPDRAGQLATLVTIAQDDRWLKTNRAVQEELASLGGVHDYEEAIGNHGWKYWETVVPRHVAWHAERLHPQTARAPRAASAAPFEG